MCRLSAANPKQIGPGLLWEYENMNALLFELRKLMQFKNRKNNNGKINEKTRLCIRIREIRNRIFYGTPVSLELNHRRRMGAFPLLAVMT